MNSSLSIALCTYNGESFLWQQLDSIARQTRLPDEIIVSDDGSTDGTKEIVRQFGETVPFKVEWLDNKTNLGTTENFERAIQACRGDYIFLCDQDDFWLPDKLQQVSQHLDDHPDIDVVFTDALLVNDRLESLNKTLFEELRFFDKQKKQWRQGDALDVLIQGNRVTGCTVAVRREFVNQIFPFPTDLAPINFIHDTWIAWVAALRNRINFLEQQTVLYRQHDKQQIGAEARNSPPRLKFRERFTRSQEEKLSHYRAQEVYFAKIISMLRRYPLTSQEGLEKIERARKHFQTRGTMPANRLNRIKPATTNFLLGNYHHFLDAEASWYTPYLAAIGDILE